MLCVPVAFALAVVPAAAHDPRLVEIQASASFEDAADGIREGLEANNMAIVRQIHFHDMLGMVGIESERMLTFETFHPRFGKMLYVNDKSAFIEAPLRIHLRETGEGVLIRYRLPSSVFAPYRGLTGAGVDLDTIFADVVGRVTQ